jgi:hypothetical protein
MIRLILAIFLLFSSFSATQSWASGSNTVFLPVKSRQYHMVNASRELALNPLLQSYLERIETPVYVVSVSSSIYNTIAQFAAKDYEVNVDFEGFDSVSFRYYESVDAIVGFTSYDYPVIVICP